MTNKLIKKVIAFLLGLVFILINFNANCYAGDQDINIFFNQPKKNKSIIGNTISNFINEAEQSIDLAVYDINNDEIINALLQKAKEGIQIRVIVDAKKPTKTEDIERYDEMRIAIEKLRLGSDNILNTQDDIMVFSDSPIFSYKNNSAFPYIKTTIGKTITEGNIIAEGEKKDEDVYYASQGDMHNKFIIVDSEKILTGSANFTKTAENHQQNLVLIKSREIAKEFNNEFNEMWGGNQKKPNPLEANFGKRKKKHEQHFFKVGEIPVEIYFSPQDKVVDKICSELEKNANQNIYFGIFSFSYEPLINIMEKKFTDNSEFYIEGTFDSMAWTQKWSASKIILDNWVRKPVIYKDDIVGKFHSKYMIVDAGTSSEPTVITGSANWSKNSNNDSDENLLIIKNEKIANKYFEDIQEFNINFKEIPKPIDPKTKFKWNVVGSMIKNRSYFNSVIMDGKIWSYFGLKNNLVKRMCNDKNEIIVENMPSREKGDFWENLESYDLKTQKTDLYEPHDKSGKNIGLFGFDLYPTVDKDGKKIYLTLGGFSGDWFKHDGVYALDRNIVKSIDNLGIKLNDMYKMKSYNTKKMTYKGKEILLLELAIRETEMYAYRMLLEVNDKLNFDLHESVNHKTVDAIDGCIVGDVFYGFKEDYMSTVGLSITAEGKLKFSEKQIIKLNFGEAYGFRIISYENLIFRIGGFVGGLPSKEVYIYDTDSQKWYKGPKLNNARANFTTLIDSNKLYVLGGLAPEDTKQEIECLEINKEELLNKCDEYKVYEKLYIYNYDENNMLKTIADGKGNILVSFTYDLLGNLTEIKKGE